MQVEQKNDDGSMVVRLDDEYLAVLTWVEVALVFGPFSPLLLVVVALSLLTNRWAYFTALRLLGATGHLPHASASSVNLVHYLLFSMGLFVYAASMFFHANNLRGQRVVLVWLPCCYATLLAFVGRKRLITLGTAAADFLSGSAAFRHATSESPPLLEAEATSSSGQENPFLLPKEQEGNADGGA